MIRSKIVFLLAATTLFVCCAQAMKKKQMESKERYVFPPEILHKFDYFSLIKRVRPQTTEKEFTDHITLSTREKQSDIDELTLQEFMTHTELANILINNALLPLLNRRLETETQQYRNDPPNELLSSRATIANMLPFFKKRSKTETQDSNDDKKFISHVTIANLLHNKAVLVLLGKQLQSIIEKCGKEYLLHGTGLLKTFLKELPLEFCNQALHDLPLFPLKTLTGHKKAVWSVAKINTIWSLPKMNIVWFVAKIHDDRAVSGFLDNTLKLWDLKTGKCLKTLTGHKDCVMSVAKMNDDQIVSGSADKTLKLWDLKTRKCLKTLSGHKNSVGSVVKINDHQIVSGSSDASLKLWDLTTGTCLKTLTGHKEGVCSVAKMNDDQVVSGSADKTLKLWGLKTGKCLKTFTGHKGSVNSVAKINDDQVVSGAGDDTLKLWDLTTGTCLKTLTGHTFLVNSVAKMNNDQVISGSWDETLKLWDLKTGKCLKTFTHKGPVQSVAKINDTQVISCSWDDTLKLWDLHSNGLQHLPFEQALFLKILKPCYKRGSPDHPFKNPHASNIFFDLPKVEQEYAIKNNLV